MKLFDRVNFIPNGIMKGLFLAFLQFIMFTSVLYSRGFELDLPSKIVIKSTFYLDGGLKRYSRSTLHKHIDGEDELFKRFGMKRLVHGLYTDKNVSSISVELYLLEGDREGASRLLRHFTGAGKESLIRTIGGIQYSSFEKVLFASRGEFFLRIYFYGENTEIDRERLLNVLLPPE